MGITFPTRAVTMRVFDDIKSRFPGEILPIFLDSDKFN